MSPWIVGPGAGLVPRARSEWLLFCNARVHASPATTSSPATTRRVVVRSCATASSRNRGRPAASPLDVSWHAPHAPGLGRDAVPGAGSTRAWGAWCRARSALTPLPNPNLSIIPTGRPAPSSAKQQGSPSLSLLPPSSSSSAAAAASHGGGLGRGRGRAVQVRQAHQVRPNPPFRVCCRWGSIGLSRPAVMGRRRRR